MGIREELLRRGQVPASEVDDVIAEAGRLQEHDRALNEQRATREELDKVASELDISPEYVQRALQKREEDRKAAERAAVEKAEAEKRSAQRRKLLLFGGLGVAGAVAVLALLLGLVGAGSVRSAAIDAHAAQAELVTVLERQASLAPQLVGLAGGDPGDLSSLASKVHDAGSLNDRIQAADALSTAMAKTLGQLPPPANDADAQLRLNLQYEVTGAQNRITVETRRYKEAEARWDGAADSITGRLAVGLGLADGPDDG